MADFLCGVNGRHVASISAIFHEEDMYDEGLVDTFGDDEVKIAEHKEKLMELMKDEVEWNKRMKANFRVSKYIY